MKAMQDYFPDEGAVCFGCGRLNEHGLHVRTYWDGSEGVAQFTPQPYHHGWPGVLYGGITASLIDCHCMSTAMAALYQAEGRDPGTEPSIACVTASLSVSYLKPTPMGLVTLRARIKELGARKAIVTCSVYAGEAECSRAEVVAVRVAGAG
jgi:acyl-coenzyme A thioesterase PaaI-like protein